MLILGHRGAIIPEAPFSQNSLPAFAEALTVADGFETDACLSKDGEVFLIHEAKYVDAGKGVEYCMSEHLDEASRKEAGQRRMEELTEMEIRGLRLKDTLPIPDLATTLQMVAAKPGKVINIELKAYGVTDTVLRRVKSALQRGEIKAPALILSSFNHDALPDVRRMLPSIKIGAIFIGPDQPDTPLFPWHPGDHAAYTMLTPEALRQPSLQEAQPDYVVIPEAILTSATLATVTEIYPKAQLIAWVFTEKGAFDLPGLIARIRAMPPGKVAAIIADNPRAFVKAWQSR